MRYTSRMRSLEAVRRFGAFAARLGTAAGFIAVVNWLFDYPFSGWVIWHFGPLAGGAAILAVAPALNYGIVQWYRRTTPDWFGAEWLRTQEALNADSWSGRAVRALLKKSRPLAFAAISAFVDPTYAFIYQRGRTTGVRFSPHDWWWFGAANVIGILPWILGMSIAVETFKTAVS